jgi:hypothetical protein
MVKLELKYEILLKMQENVSLDPKELDGERSENELAILELESEGLVKTNKGQFSQYGRFIRVLLTDKGVLKQYQLRKEKSESTSKKIAKCGKDVAKSIGSTLKDITIGVVTGVITSTISDKIPKP